MTYIIGIVLLFAVSVSASGDIGFSLNLNFYMQDDYNNLVQMPYTIFSTNQDTIIPNYRNAVLFYLYTRNRTHDSVQLYVDDTDSLRLDQFDSKKPTIFVTHGWLNSYQSQSCTYIRDAYLKLGEYNVILIDWSAIASGPYNWATNQIVHIAQYIGRMIDFLESEGMYPSNMTVIGHSLAACIAGLSSYNAKNEVNYVVGLDPAAPGFHNKSRDSKISKDDASYVQVIHTTSVLGLSDQFGHADIYVNGAMIQNDCYISEFYAHIRAYEYFAESINGRGFLARRCDNFFDFERRKCDSNVVVYMGGAIPDYKAQGTYYLTTNLKLLFTKNNPVAR